MDDYDAYGDYLANWKYKESALFYSLGYFFFVYSRLEEAVQTLIITLCAIPPENQVAFSGAFFDRVSLGGLTRRLAQLLKAMQIDTESKLTKDLERLSRERNQLAHDLVGSIDDPQQEPGFIFRGNGNDDPRSHEGMLSLIEECIALSDQVLGLSAHFGKGGYQS